MYNAFTKGLLRAFFRAKIRAKALYNMGAKAP